MEPAWGRMIDAMIRGLEEIRRELVPPDPLPVPAERDLGQLEPVISTRLYNCLRNECLLDLDLLLQKTPSQIRKIPNLGRVTFNELNEILARHGMRLSEP